MKRFLALALLLLYAACAAAQLMPAPVKLVAGQGALPIDANFWAATAGGADGRLQSAIHRLIERISRQTGIPLGIAAKDRPTLTVQCRESGPGYPALDDDESYQLDVRADGARLDAHTVAGALHGLATFAQLIEPGAGGFQIAAAHIEDKPRFPWRGLMIDVSRHWIPLAAIERNLDAMAAVKLNVLHWHLSDDQGFRVESKRFPRLQQLGSDGLFYTQDEIRQAVSYARDRGIRVIPEFDMPGHTTSWLVGYPELASAPGPYSIGRRWGIYEPVMDPSREETYKFLDGFLDEMTALFPDPYFHIGGDEVKDTHWKASAAIQDFARQHKLASSHEIQTYFNQRVQELLKKHGKIMIGWDEILRPGLARDTVIQSWRGQKSLADAAQQGYRGILSSGYYLDHLDPAANHYKVDPLPAGDDPRILGGEACMWTEYVSAETLDSRIWPRTAAIAERLWSPRNVADVDSMYRRMEAVSRQLDFLGVRHRTGYTAMLDRLSGGRPAPALRGLADAVESSALRERRARNFTSLDSLNRLVDAAQPESESVRALEQAAKRLAANPKNSPADLAAVRNAFFDWRDQEAAFTQLARNNFLLAELVPLSKGLAQTGTIGLEALGDLLAGTAPDADWIAQRKKMLDDVSKPQAEVRLAAVRVVRILIDAFK